MKSIVKPFAIIFSIILISSSLSCSLKENNSDSVEVVKEVDTIPKVIDSLGIQDLYLDARFFLYHIGATQPIMREIDHFSSTPSEDYAKRVRIMDSPIVVGNFPFRFDSVSVNGDTLVFNFNYYLSNGYPINELTFERFASAGPTQLMYIKGSKYIGPDSMMCLISNRHGLKYAFQSVKKIALTNIPRDTLSLAYKKINPFDKGVINYYKQNKAQFNPWFIKELYKRFPD